MTMTIDLVGRVFIEFLSNYSKLNKVYYNNYNYDTIHHT